MNLTRTIKKLFKSDQRFFPQDDFNYKVGTLESEVDELYENLKSVGLLEDDSRSIDFSFVSNEKSKIKLLDESLHQKEYIKITNYSYDLQDKLHYIEGEVVPLNINKKNLYAILNDLLLIGYENDSVLSGYGVYTGS